VPAVFVVNGRRQLPSAYVFGMRASVRAAAVLSVLQVAGTQEPVVLREAGPATCGITADLDGDGDFDLVLGIEDRPLVLLANDGKGSFAAAEGAFTADEGKVRALAAFDADGDHDLDVLVGGVDALTRWWRNDGGLRFVDASAGLPETKLWVTSIVTGDLDGDGDHDVVLGNFAGPSVVFRNDRNRFVRADGALPQLQAVTALALADLDDDRDLDLIFAQVPDARGRGGRNRAARNDGRGKFTDATEAWMPSAAQATAALALADLDGDRRLDLVCANRGTKPKEGARNGVHRRGDGAFLNSAPSRYAGAPAVSQAVAAADVDGDGDVDLVFGNDGPDALYLNDGNGTFAGGALPALSDDTRAVLLVDVDGDRDLDLVTVNHGAPTRLYANAGAGQFGGNGAGNGPAGRGESEGEGATGSVLMTVAGGKYASRALARSAMRESGPRQAIDAALRFFADNQAGDGSFRAAAFVGGRSNDPPVPATHDVGVTGLVLLCFLAEASHPRGGFYADHVQRGVQWLLGQQQDDGRFGSTADQHAIYDHAIATLALAEAGALSADAALLPPLQKALSYIEDRRNRDGGFRYERATGTSDTSVTAWCALAQMAGSDVGVTMPAGAAERTTAFLRSMTDAVTGRTGYSERGGLSSRYPGEPTVRFPPEASEAMTGAALAVRLALGEDPADSEDLRPSVARCAAALPKAEPDGYFDPYAWFHIAHALAPLGGSDWLHWRKALHEVVVPRQRRSGELVGSWDPNDPWGTAGGRFATTALTTLALQAEYRFTRRPDDGARKRAKGK